MHLNMANILDSLDIMWKGMLGIFVTILIIMVLCFHHGKNWWKKRR